MRTDNELRTDVLAELSWDVSIQDKDIATAVKDGVVTIAGVVDSWAQRYAAERAVGRVKGVKAIVNELTVRLPGSLERSDADLAHAAVNVLALHVEVPRDRIRVKVTNGHLLLEGEVDWFYQKTAAEKAVRYLAGVKGVTNLITLRMAATPADIKDRIRASLKRQAELDADHISIDVNGSRITLRGTVRSVAERRDAEAAAWNAPGVVTVLNDLNVAPPLPAMV
jgi:osmotically-inducible protein OsmY